jgi:ECF transporter S component (folate family)
MFGAVSIVLGYLTIMPIETLKISFVFLPNEFIYFLFGPAVGAIFGAAMDILNFIIKPMGDYFFGFTLSGILTGLLYGFILYKKPVSLVRIFITTLIRVILIDILLNTYWLTILQGYNYTAMLPVRAVKNFIMLPVETILLFGVIKAVEATGILKTFRNKENRASGQKG